MWFDFCVLYLGWLIGNMIFYKFEMHVPVWKRLLKLLVLSVLFLVIYHFFSRTGFYSVLGLMLVGISYLHAIYLPKKGINGLTAEPYEKYLQEIRKVKGKKK